MTIFFKWILYPREFYVCKTFLVPRKVVEKSIKSSPIWILWAERVLADGASRRNSTAHIQWAVYQEEKIILLLLSTAGDSSWQKNYVTCRTKQKDANISFLAIAFNSTYLVLRALLCLLSWAFDERQFQLNSTNGWFLHIAHLNLYQILDVTTAIAQFKGNKNISPQGPLINH